MIDRSARGHNRPQRILQGFFVAGLPPDLYIGHQAEDRAAPVRPAPGVRVVYALVASAGSPLCMSRTMSCHICSGFEFCRFTRAIGLDIGRQAFFHPMLIVGREGNAM